MTFDSTSARPLDDQPEPAQRFNPAEAQPAGDALLRAQIRRAMGTDPLKASQAEAIARARDLDPEFVLRNYDQVLRETGVEDMARALEVDPMVGDYFRYSPLFAAKAQKDAGALIDVHGTIREFKGPEPTFENIARGLAASLPQGLDIVRTGLQGQMRDFLQWAGLVQPDPVADADFQRKLAQAQGAGDFTRPEIQSRTGRAIYGGLESTLRTLPGVAASVVTRSPTPALATMGLQTQADAYGKYRTRGGAPLESFLGATGEGAVEVATELLPTKFLTEALGKRGVGEFLTGLLVRELPSEQVATLLQDAIDTAVANPNKTWEEYLAERPGAAYDTLVSTLTQTLVTGGAAKVLSSIAGTADEMGKAEVSARQLQAAFSAAAMVEMRQHAPQDFAQAIQSIAEQEGANDAIYMDAEVLAQSGIDIAQALPSAVDQMADALELNATVRLPIGEVLAAVAGTPQEQLFLQNARASETAWSLAEAEQIAETSKEFLANEQERVLQQAQDQSAWQSEVDNVQQTIKDQLDQAGRFTSDVNEGYARLQSQFFSVMASRFGITPTEMYQRFSVKVAGQMGQGEVLNAEYDQNAIGGVLDGGRMGINVRSDTSAGVRYADELVDGRKQFETRDSDSLRAYVGKRIAIVRTGEGPAKAIGEVTLGEPRIVNEEEFRQLQAEHLVPEGSTFDVKPGGVKYLYPVSEPVRYGAEKDVGAGIVSRRVLGQPGAEFNQSALADDAVDEASDDAPSAMEQADVPTSVDDAAALSSALRVATSSIWRKGRDLKVAIQNAVQAAARAAGVDVSVESPQSEAYLIRVGLRDALDALKQNANAVGWYDLKTRQALAVMSLVHPELATDEDARLAFVWIMAVTSNGLKVGKNFELAETAYRRYKQDGRMPTDVGVGNASKAINDSLGLFDTLKTQWGSENLRKFMLTPFLVEEISALSKDLTPGGEHADVEVRGAAILGPKIGNGFFSNLYGNFDALTMDRWLIRTWGRWSGTLIKDMPRHTAEARARVREVMTKIEANPAERDRLSALISHTFDTSTEAGLDAIALAVQKASMKPNLRAEMNKTDVGSELRLSGNGLAKYLDGQKEAPSGPWERKYIRRVFQGILAELKGQSEYANLTMADLQAVLWYAEKRLYEAAKTDLAAEDEVDGYEDDEAPDYANAAVDVARSAGVSERKIQNALKREENDGRSATARSASDSQTGSQGQPREAGGFTGREKREFRATVAIHRARRFRSALTGDERSPWTYTRRSGTDGPRVRVLKKLGIKYTEQWKAGTALARTLKNNGQKVPTFYELDSGSADKFRDAIAASKAASPFGAAVYVYPLEEYQGMRLFLSEEGAGFALKPDGDIVSVFGGGGTGHATMDLAITLGGRKLDCFDTVLPRIYSVHGFVPAARLTWDDSQAPEGWSKQNFGEYNDGEPDVLFMAYDPTSFAPYATGAGSRVSTYNGALRVQARAVRNAFGVAQPNLFEQQARGTFNPQTLLISLGPQSDLSTFLHESGHFFLEVMADLAAQPDAPAQVREDMDKVRAWFATGSGTAMLAKVEQDAKNAEADAARAEQAGDADAAQKRAYATQVRSAYTFAVENGGADYMKTVAATFGQDVPRAYRIHLIRQFHERWAESFEQYLLEGKAPSAELQPLFRRFRAWLVNVYKSLTDFMRGRNLEVNDEIRQVFDRMLATDAEIAQAEEVAGLLPDFDGTNEAIERLQARKMRDLKWTLNARSKFLKQFTREAREARKLILQEVLAEFDQRPDAIAARAIRKVRNKEGAERDAKLEGIAAAQGYGSVQEMDVAVQALGPVNEAVEAEVDRRMTERYGELSTPEALEKAANEAVYNEAHIRSLATELKTQQEALSERQSTGRVNATGRPITVNALVAAAKQFAEDITSRRRVRDLKSAAQQHRAATARATKRWEQATRKGETKDAIQAQKDRLLNAQAAKTLLEAQAEVEKTIGYLRKFNKDSIRQKLPPEYLDQIDKLLERVDLRASVSGKQIDKRASLKAWIESQNELGIDPIIPENLLEDIRLTSYKMMTVEEIRGLHDTIRNIEHLGKLKSKLLKAKDKREFDAAATAWADNIRANGGEAVVRLEPDGRLTRLFKGFWAEHRKLNSLVRQMDGGQDGGIGFRLLIASMNEQGTQEDVALEKAAAALGPIFAPVDALPGGLSGGQVYIPEISASLSRAARLAIALNWGNTQNRQRVMDGDGWTQVQVEAVLATLTPTELEFVNKVWEHLDSYWPEIKAKQQRVSGLVEEKVAAEPFAIKIADGTIVEMRGGYYPIKYDPDRSVRAQVNDAKQAAMDMLRGAMLRPTTRRGHTKARVDEVYGRPIRKDLAPITQHITQVVHDLAWHEWAIDANRLLADKRIAAAIREHYGPETHRAMTDAVEAIVTGDVGKQTDVDKILLLIRSNVTRSIMGVSATTALLQPFGLTQSMARIGVTPVLKGAWRWAGDAVKMESSLEWIHNKSDFMRLRAKTFNRDLREINQQIQGRWKVTQVMDAALFAPMQKMQMIADVPTWIGAYEKALSEGQTEELAVAIADEAVLSSQGGGSIKDLSDVQRNHPFLTQFYSYFNATLQLVAESTALTNWKNPRAVAGWVGDMALLAMIPAILPALITYALKGGGEDDEPEDWAKRIAGWQASYLLGMFVGLRELPALWGPFDYQGPPAGKLINDGKRLVQQANQGEIDDPAVLAAISLIGTVLGLPTTQVIRSYKGWQAWDEGDAPASSILFGPPPKD